MRDCPPFGQWQLGPADRGSSGSLAINDLSGTDAEPRHAGRLQAWLCRAAGTGTALDGLSPGTGAWPALRGVGAAWTGLVNRAGHMPARPRLRPSGYIRREPLSLHLRSAPAHLGLQLAPLSAPRQEQAGCRGRKSASSKAAFPGRNARARPPIARSPAIRKPI